jgi:hypothetical protein
MADLDIRSLSLNIENASGCEHRVQTIAARAAALFATWLDERVADSGPSASVSVESLSALPVSLNLSSTSDEQAANDIANAWLEAVALKLRL